MESNITLAGPTEPRLEWAALNGWSFDILGSNIPPLPGPIMCSSPFFQRQIILCCRQYDLGPVFQEPTLISYTRACHKPQTAFPTTDTSSTTGSAGPCGPIGPGPVAKPFPAPGTTQSWHLSMSPGVVARAVSIGVECVNKNTK